MGERLRRDGTTSRSFQIRSPLRHLLGDFPVGIHMPLYPFVCDACGEELEVRRHMEARDNPQLCGNGHPMRRRLVFPMAQIWAGKFHDRWNQVNPQDGTEKLGPSW